MSDSTSDSDDPLSASLAAGEQGDDNSGLKKVILILSISILLITGIIGGLWVSGVFGESETAAETEEAGDEAVEDDTPDRQPASSGVFYDLPQMLVNLASSGRRASFLKITLSLELGGPADLPLIEQALPRITDTLQVYLRELRPEDLKGSSGIHRLREELLTRLDTSADPVEVQDILFKEILVQ